MSEKQYNTATGRVVPTSEAGLTFAALLETAAGFQLLPKRLTNGAFKNTGDTALSIAILQDGHSGAPTTAQYYTVGVDEVFVFERINVDYVYVRTADDTGANSLQFFGTPVSG